MDREAIEDMLVETDGRPIEAIADEILKGSAWLQPDPRRPYDPIRLIDGRR